MFKYLWLKLTKQYKAYLDLQRRFSKFNSFIIRIQFYGNTTNQLETWTKLLTRCIKNFCDFKLKYNKKFSKKFYSNLFYSSDTIYQKECTKILSHLQKDYGYPDTILNPLNSYNLCGVYLDYSDFKEDCISFFTSKECNSEDIKCLINELIP